MLLMEITNNQIIDSKISIYKQCGQNREEIDRNGKNKKVGDKNDKSLKIASIYTMLALHLRK